MKLKESAWTLNIIEKEEALKKLLKTPSNLNPMTTSYHGNQLEQDKAILEITLDVLKEKSKSLMNYEQDLKEKEQSLLEQLRNEIAMEAKGSTEVLRTYLRQGRLLAILQAKKTFTEDLEKLKNHLLGELGKLGFDFDEFVERANKS